MKDLLNELSIRLLIAAKRAAFVGLYRPLLPLSMALHESRRLQSDHVVTGQKPFTYENIAIKMGYAL